MWSERYVYVVKIRLKRIKDTCEKNLVSPEIRRVCAVSVILKLSKTMRIAIVWQTVECSKSQRKFSFSLSITHSFSNITHTEDNCSCNQLYDMFCWWRLRKNSNREERENFSTIKINVDCDN
jgi:hypothetical protein